MGREIHMISVCLRSRGKDEARRTPGESCVRTREPGNRFDIVFALCICLSTGMIRVSQVAH